MFLWFSLQSSRMVSTSLTLLHIDLTKPDTVNHIHLSMGYLWYHYIIISTVWPWSTYLFFWVYQKCIYSVFKLKMTVSSRSGQTFNRAWNQCPSLIRWTQWLKITGSLIAAATVIWPYHVGYYFQSLSSSEPSTRIPCPVDCDDIVPFNPRYFTRQDKYTAQAGRHRQHEDPSPCRQELPDRKRLRRPRWRRRDLVSVRKTIPLTKFAGFNAKLLIHQQWNIRVRVH